MNDKIIDILANYYLFDISEYMDEPEEQTAFFDEIIEPAFEKDHKAGCILENKFLSAVSAVEIQSFKRGFKSCAKLLTSSFDD